ncbi:MAG: RluA family pseudouridine synthase [Chitinivibrionia bacterium]|nr:RluA family pseudouridine synthase [Chitinivibrionia bacterium]
MIEKISFEFAGERLDLFVWKFFENLSRNKIQESIQRGHVLVNEKREKKSYLLRENDEISINEEKVLEENSRNLTVIPQEIPLDIIWEDENYIAINKPAHLTVHPAIWQKSGTLLNGLYFYADCSVEKFTPKLVHRLDKDTSGIIVAAKSDNAHEKLAEKFANREIYKKYFGICTGKFPNEMSGVMEFPIGRDKKDPLKRAVNFENGREARTDYEIINYESGIYFTSFRLHSGRTHQIRVHCSHCGFPIICDEMYGGNKEKIKFLQQENRPFALKIYDCFSRQALHARRLAFEHPFTKEEISLTAPFPADFEKAIEIIGVSKDFL